jgi:hypothetical protein
MVFALQRNRRHPDVAPRVADLAGWLFSVVLPDDASVEGGPIVMTDWVPPNLTDESFVVRIGTSLIEGFALSHTPSDVLRELVQNEYDAGGSRVEIDFGPDALNIRGDGEGIDRAGWARLSVVLGTGAVVGLDERVAPKVNGIGSKNFGLRSLFLFGDRIFIRSRGLQTVLDSTAGALRIPQPDPTTDGQTGIAIHVPYRLTDAGAIKAFDQAAEEHAIAEIVRDLAPTLSKLASTGGRKSIKAVHLRSERTGRHLIWRQTVKALRTPVPILRRNVRIEQLGDVEHELPPAIDEIEYQRSLAAPPALRGTNVPAYYKVAGGRIRLGLSFRIKSGRIDRSATGVFYYPLGARRASTGFPFSVSAPFEMTDDRSQLRDLDNSPWNAWLIEEAAGFAISLIEGPLFASYGVDGFRSIDPRLSSGANVPELGERIRSRLETDECWPTQAVLGRTKKPVLASLSSVCIPASSALSQAIGRGLVSADRVLHLQLARNAQVADLALELGAKRFSLSALVRLRCAGDDDSHLATRLSAGDIAYRYKTNFPDALRDLGTQRAFADAFDAEAGRLTTNHRTDLRRSPTTLSAAGTLVSPEKAWRVAPAIAATLPLDSQLHPDLASSRVLAALCRPFNASRWAI